ncbi:Ankyrin repeat domain-containing protein 1 [Hondaea fermentalgiana]|uniref:receptor protein-tyrosine kinase n=1 Tax=Hondaea fermentalgiana TaxID=2315210 RepID=A0A2R5GYJ3_9STRA|nr:Ankyrin repeat domain-containing protein 1 [Hondaea fermentalgiana]|eukprot:GBG33054.1 Ankyrin repeat domain-containing protein 1 [Hondaea fermentalgiana]
MMGTGEAGTGHATGRERKNVDDDDDADDEEKNDGNHGERKADDGDDDEDDEAEKNRRAAILDEEAQKVEDNFQVPVELEATFTPAEIDQLIMLFEELDEDESGAIDVDELRHAFTKLGEDATDDQLEDLIEEFDEDCTGTIDFGEFLHLIARFQKEDGRVNKMARVFEQMNETPLKMLERECSRRKLELRYKLIEVREATSMHPPQFIMAAEVSGCFLEIGPDGHLQKSQETRAYEGIGINTRTAKFNAATTAMTQLREHIPGIDYEPGEIPDSWLRWFAENIDRGVDEIELLEKLTVKGFFPCKNNLFMQKMSLRVSMLRMQRKDPGLWPASEGRELPPEWIHWAQGHMKRGVHGKVVLSILVENGFRPKRNPLLSELLTRDTGGSYSDKVRPISMDFWQCAASGFMEELRRYMAAGQEVDAPKLMVGHETTALALAIKHKQLEATIYLLDQGADLNAQDKYGRRSTHMAAQAGSLDILQLLISRGADAVSPDKYGDTPLHISCGHGHVKTACFLLDWYNERMRRIVSGRDALGEGASFHVTARAAYDAIIEARLSRFLTPRFKKIWMVAALQEFCARTKGATFKPIAETATPATDECDKSETSSKAGGTADSIATTSSVDNVIEFVQNLDPKSGFVLYPPGPHVIHAAMNRFDFCPEREYLEYDEYEYILARCLYGGWINQKNSIGRAPLTCTVDPSQGEISDAHIAIGTALINEHGAEIAIRDKNERTVMDILELKLKNFGGMYMLAVENAKAERESEKKEMDVEIEPLVNDKLFKMLQRAGEIDAHWKRVLQRSSRLRQVENFAEMVYEPTGQLYYADEHARCQWSKPTSVLECDHILFGWAQLKMKSKRVHTHGTWDVYEHKETGQIFYHDFEHGESQWERPAEMDLEAAPCDESDADEIATLGFWHKWRLRSSGRVYYVHAKTSARQFERPLEWSDYVDKTSTAPESIQENWRTMHTASERVRVFGEWEECRDVSTLNVFYWNKTNAQGTWERPMHVLEVEQACFLYEALRARDDGRVRKRLQVFRRARDENTKIEWREEVDNFRDTKGVVSCISYFVGVDEVAGRTLALSRVPPPFEGLETTAEDGDDEEGGSAEAKQAAETQSPTQSPQGPSVRRGSTTPMPRRRRKSSVDLIPPEIGGTRVRRRSSVSHLTGELMNKAAQTMGDTLQRMLLMIQAAEERMNEGYVLCDWGCKDWIEPAEVEYHRLERCRRRQLPCTLGCGLVLRAEEWTLARETHETMECPKRMVPCDNRCGETIRFDLMKDHLTHDCVKRPVPALPCKLGCGWKISGGLEDQDHMQWEASQHELHECALRQVRCDWLGCMAEMEARELPMHRQDHLHRLGITTWTTPGSYKWRVPRKCRSLLVQLWGGGGGAGILRGRRGGNGGGGGFVEAELAVYPKEELIIVVGSGGETRDDEEPREFYPEDDFQRVAKGGFPGGGDGYSNNFTFACGGGGGYSAVLRQGAFGEELLLLAGGGGGGGTRNGHPGGDEKADPIDFDGIQRHGGPGTQTRGGAPGDFPDNVLIEAEPGTSYQGGHGAHFGGGGGGGLFGGGGGGFTPGVVGGGGGGSSFVNREVAKRHRTLSGVAHEAGGKDADLPASTGLGDWDAVGRFAGFGGCATKTTVEPGCAGAVRVRLPTHFATKVPERHLRLPSDEERRRVLAAALQAPEDDRSCFTCPDPDDEPGQGGEHGMSNNALEDEHEGQAGEHTGGAPYEGEEEEGDDDDDDEEEEEDLEGEFAELPSEFQTEEADPYDSFSAGTRIQCRYQGKAYNPWYAGIIADVNTDGTFDIQYDDGDMDFSIPLEMIRLEVKYGELPPE